MTKVVSVRFRTAGRAYYFDPAGFEIKKGDHVIVETVRGMEYGSVVENPKEVEDEKITAPLKPILRIAGERDAWQEGENRELERAAVPIAKQKIRERELPMKLIDVEYTFDRSKIVFYFTSDGRVDFRELVKDLAGIFHTRIELRQIGVRDATKLLGGIGSCGRVLCCHSYMADFVPVSIKMAKEQNLSLNPGKISGMCGRLMCCLQYEADTYSYLNKNLPGTGDIVMTPDQTEGVVQSVDVLRQRVKVVVDAGGEKEIEEYPVEEITFKRRRGRKDENKDLTPEEIKELRKLEKSEGGAAEKAEGNRKGRNRDKNENRNDGEGRDKNENRNEGRDRDRNENRNRNENRDRGEGRNKGENRDNKEGRDRRGRDRNENRDRNEGRNENRDRNEGEGRNKNENREKSEGDNPKRNNRRNRHRGDRRNKGGNDDSGANGNNANGNNAGDGGNGTHPTGGEGSGN